MSTPAAVRVRGLSKAYGSMLVVDDLSFDVAPGTVCALLGPNGAGKTTTVECIEGFRRPDAGEVSVLGLDPRRDRDALVARMGVMLQEGGAWQAATPREMLRLYARFHARPADVEQLLAEVGIAGVADRRFRILSGGQKQRLNLALALVGHPEVVFLDEPTAGMDPQARQATWTMVRRLRAEGVTVLLTTHFMDEAERLADEVVLIDGGRLVAQDSPAALVASGAGDELLVTTTAAVDLQALQRELGISGAADGSGRYRLDVGAEAIPRVTGWFDRNGLPLTGIDAGGGGLEEVFLRLTGRQVRE